MDMMRFATKHTHTQAPHMHACAVFPMLSPLPSAIQFALPVAKCASFLALKENICKHCVSSSICSETRFSLLSFRRIFIIIVCS